MRRFITVETINICNYLKLDSFGVNFLFSSTRTELIEFFNDNNISINMPSEVQIVFKSKLLLLDVVFYVSCYFDSEKLIAVTISPDTNLEGKSLICRYNKIQRAMESELGYPRNRWWSIICLFAHENRSFYWEKNGVKIEHYILKKNGTSENLENVFSDKILYDAWRKEIEEEALSIFYNRKIKIKNNGGQ